MAAFDRLVDRKSREANSYVRMRDFSHALARQLVPTATRKLDTTN